FQPQHKKAQQPDYTAWKKMIIEGSPDQAAALIENYLKTSTGDARALVILGDAKNAGHDYQGARSAYLEAAAADKGSYGANALFKMSVLLEKKIGDLDAAEKGFSSYLSRYPTGSLAEQARLHLAKILVNTDRPEQAKKHLEILVQTQPGPTRKEAMKLLEEIK
ncbi:MAG: tetratricopeptide repeat protein, partial [Actinobacteria bacterium]|nr:tetratricopeptide repeat protein [Actinomycetota bacterium]